MFILNEYIQSWWFYTKNSLYWVFRCFTTKLDHMVFYSYNLNLTTGRIRFLLGSKTSCILIYNILCNRL